MRQPDRPTAAAAQAIPSTALLSETSSAAPNYGDLARAIAAFERTQVLDAPFDRFIAGDETAIIAGAARLGLFNGRARCISCHAMSGTSRPFSDNKFHNIGVSAHAQNFVELARRASRGRSGDARGASIAPRSRPTSRELGRFLVTKKHTDIGAFKTPSSATSSSPRPTSTTARWTTLWDVMDHYNKGGEAEPVPRRRDRARSALGENEIDQVVAFLFALTDDRFAALGKTELGGSGRCRARSVRSATTPRRIAKAQWATLGPFGDRRRSRATRP